jgi:hypothetical protein
MVDTICEDGTVVVGRLDGTFDGGEFYIEIIELREYRMILFFNEFISALNKWW